MIANRFHESAWFGRVTTGAESVMKVLEDLNDVKKFGAAFCEGLRKLCLRVPKVRMVLIDGA